MTNLTTGVYNTTWGLSTTGTTITLPSAPGLATVCNTSSPSISVSGKIRLDGAGADIEVNGVSLMDTLKAIQARLNILSVNKDLEEDWDELKKLGDMYRKLEIKVLEKSRMWESLKSAKK